jgi:hypothetical protein
VIHKGQIRSSGEIDELTQGEGNWVEVEVEGALAPFQARLASENYAVEAIGETRLRVKVIEGDADRLFELAAGCAVILSEVALERASLEDVFLETLAKAEAQ